MQTQISYTLELVNFNYDNYEIDKDTFRILVAKSIRRITGFYPHFDGKSFSVADTENTYLDRVVFLLTNRLFHSNMLWYELEVLEFRKHTARICIRIVYNE